MLLAVALFGYRGIRFVLDFARSVERETFSEHNHSLRALYSAGSDQKRHPKRLLLDCKFTKHPISLNRDANGLPYTKVISDALARWNLRYN